jgi:hypothetical protein
MFVNWIGRVLENSHECLPRELSGLEAAAAGAKDAITKSASLMKEQSAATCWCQQWVAVGPKPLMSEAGGKQTATLQLR